MSKRTEGIVAQKCVKHKHRPYQLRAGASTSTRRKANVDSGHISQGVRGKSLKPLHKLVGTLKGSLPFPDEISAHRTIEEDEKLIFAQDFG